jgi:hypothetical protein
MCYGLTRVRVVAGGREDDIPARRLGGVRYELLGTPPGCGYARGDVVWETPRAGDPQGPPLVARRLDDYPALEEQGVTTGAELALLADALDEGL